MERFQQMLSKHLEEAAREEELARTKRREEAEGMTEQTCTHPKRDEVSGTVICLKCGEELDDVSNTGQPLKPTQNHIIRTTHTRRARRPRVPKICLFGPDGNSRRVKYQR